ncbi:MAG: MATE family efflux transporter [Dorea sp.]
MIAIATMMATGGNAIISKYLGEGKKEKAKERLTMFVVITLIVSGIIMLVTLSFLNRICYMLGATDELLMYCRNYLMILVIFTPACMLQSLFQSYLVTAERPTLGLILIILAGVLNAMPDYVPIVNALPSGNPWCRSCNRNRAVGTGWRLRGWIFFFANKRGFKAFTRFRGKCQEIFCMHVI